MKSTTMMMMTTTRNECDKNEYDVDDDNANYNDYDDDYHRDDCDNMIITI